MVKKPTTTELRAQAVDHVTRARSVVERQRLLIADILQSGGDASDAEQLLASFEHSLAQFEAELKNIDEDG